MAPLQSRLQHKLGRTLNLRAVDDSAAAQPALHFWGGLRLQSSWLEISAPVWSKAPYLLAAQDVDVRLRYGDVWRAWQGQQLVVQALSAGQLTAYLERTADGRASWQLAAGSAAPEPPRVQSMDVRSGTLHVTDAPLALSLDADLTLSSAVPTLSATQAPQSRVLRGSARGHYRKGVPPSAV